MSILFELGDNFVLNRKSRHMFRMEEAQGLQNAYLVDVVQGIASWTHKKGGLRWYNNV